MPVDWRTIATFVLIGAVWSLRKRGLTNLTLILGVLAVLFAVDRVTLWFTPHLHHAYRVWCETHCGGP
jgi:hypothetical protein